MGEGDKRFSARHSVTFPVICDDGGAYIDGTVLDLSLGGCFVHTRKLLEVGTEVSVSPIGEATDKVLEWQAKVVRVVDTETIDNPPGMGLQFTRMKRSAFEALKKMFETMPKTTVDAITDVPGRPDSSPASAVQRIRIRARRK